jgi:hypothetical protein
MPDPEAWWRVEERPFRSDLPLIGRWIVRFRTLWNRIATQWYVRPLIQQQNEVNRRLVHELAALREEVAVNQAMLGDLDREGQDARRAQMGAVVRLQDEVRRLRQRVEDLERRLSHGD